MEPIPAIAELLLLQVPPEAISFRFAVNPWQTLFDPVIEGGVGLIVTVILAEVEHTPFVETTV